MSMFVTDPGSDLEYEALDLIGNAERRLALTLPIGLDQALLVLHLGDVLAAGQHGHAPGEKVVASVSGLDLHHVTHGAEVFDVFAQDHFHGHRAILLVDRNTVVAGSNRTQRR